MSQSGREIESKYFVRSLAAVQARLEALAAEQVQQRTHERNLRLDRPDSSLRLKGQVLRLRQDTDSTLTYKGPGTAEDGVYARDEFEVRVSDLEAVHTIFQRLGYTQVVFYEKYRTIYHLNEVLVMLDEMPYGDFVEIEGASPQSIQAAAARLGLDHTRAICSSYMALFDTLQARRGLKGGDLSFKALGGQAVTAADLGVEPAD